MQGTCCITSVLHAVSELGPSSCSASVHLRAGYSLLHVNVICSVLQGAWLGTVSWVVLYHSGRAPGPLKSAFKARGNIPHL